MPRHYENIIPALKEPITSIRNIGTKYPYKVTLTTNLFYH